MPEQAIRTQVDDLDGYYSDLTAIDCSNLPDLARQEFKDETDVNKVLARYGVDGIQRKPEYSEVDYDTDLQQSLNAIREAQRAIAKLPDALRAKYNRWEYLMDGAANGELKTDLEAYHAQKAADAAAAAAAAKIKLDTANPVT